jgi:hypothetical protein
VFVIAPFGGNAVRYIRFPAASAVSYCAARVSLPIGRPVFSKGSNSEASIAAAIARHRNSYRSDKYNEFCRRDCQC